jgi:hypothetical protein
MLRPAPFFRRFESRFQALYVRVLFRGWASGGCLGLCFAGCGGSLCRAGKGGGLQFLVSVDAHLRGVSCLAFGSGFIQRGLPCDDFSLRVQLGCCDCFRYFRRTRC